MRSDSAASVEGNERLRLFCGLPLPAETVRALVSWQERELGAARDVRPVPPGNLHVTLAFLGSRPTAELDGIIGVLREAADYARPPVLTPARYRETRSVGMVVFDDAEGRAAALAVRLWEGLERLGVYERERRNWLPHVTVLRFRRPPRLSPALPDLGPVSPSEAALYHSVLRRAGAQYEIVESVALGG
jgi:RNA 2',3'-cyclic 3'-phosphodiesterase